MQQLEIFNETKKKTNEKVSDLCIWSQKQYILALIQFFYISSAYPMWVLAAKCSDTMENDIKTIVQCIKTIDKYIHERYRLLWKYLCWQRCIWAGIEKKKHALCEWFVDFFCICSFHSFYFFTEEVFFWNAEVQWLGSNLLFWFSQYSFF